MSEHTPGPWFVERDNPDNPVTATGLKWIGAPEGGRVACLVQPSDADLIAAAPELLAACEAAHKVIVVELAFSDDRGRRTVGFSDWSDLVDLLDNATRKAKGEV